MPSAPDPRVDAYIASLPDWQQSICREVRDLVHRADSEIEGLENTLKALRYKATAPPELPAKTLVIEQKPQRRFLRFGFALAFA